MKGHKKTIDFTFFKRSNKKNNSKNKQEKYLIPKTAQQVKKEKVIEEQFAKKGKNNSNIPKINRKKTKLILFFLAITVFLIIIFGVLKTPKQSKAQKSDEQGKNKNIPSDFIITAEDRRRFLEDNENESRMNYLKQQSAAGYKVNTDNINIPQEYLNGQRTRNNDGTPIRSIREYAQNKLMQAQAEYAAEKGSKGLYVANWGGDGKTSSKGSSALGSALNLLGSNSTSALENTSNTLAKALGNSQNDYLNQNQQESKNNFVSNAQSKKSDGVMYTEVRDVVSPYTITAGSVIPLTLITGINSDLPGDIVGQVNRNVYDSVSGNYLLIPAGSKVVGEYDSGVSWGQRRVLVIWSRLVFPNGSSIDLQGMQGVDLSGFSGYNDVVDAHVGEIVGLTIASTILDIGTGQLSSFASQQTNEQLSALTQALTNGANKSKGILNRIAEKIINLQPTIKIRQGKRANIFIGKDMVLKPYIRSY